MLLYYSLTAIFIAWIWVDYYRLIDVYEKEKLKYLILVFLLGALSPFITFYISLDLISGIYFEMNGNLLNDLLYCILKIGIIEEFSKLVPFLVMYVLFKKQINEPVDYISYMCIAALGFSAAENILYFNSYGADIISGRSILSSLGHMMFSAFTAYGIVLYRYRKSKLGFSIIPLYFLLSSISHGLYDFWLMHQHARVWGYLITILFFLQLVSLFAVILNNALNNSEFFSYKKVIDTEKVSRRLLLYYFLIFIIQFTLITIETNIDEAISSIGFDTLLVFFIVYICAVRLSRFKLIRKRWFPLRLEMPFHFKDVQLYKNASSSRKLRIRGEAYNEVYLNKFYDENLWLNPLSKKRSYLKKSRLAFIEKKIFLYKDETYYVTKIYLDDTNTRYEYVLLKPKLVGRIFTAKKSPIVAVLRTKDMMDLTDTSLRMKNFEFIEWAYPKSYEEWDVK